MSIATAPEQIDYADLPEFDPEVQNAVVIIGVGPNTAHLFEAGALPELMKTRPVFFCERRTPVVDDLPAERVFRTDRDDEKARADALMRSGGVHAVYYSVQPGAHLPLIKEGLELAGQGLINRLVVPKPLVTNEQEAREVAAALRNAGRQRQELGIPMPQWEGKETSLLYVHEHYQRKASWFELRKRLGEVSNRLGRLQSVTIDIEEGVTVEEEGRQTAFAGGALEDLGHHVTSLIFDVAYAINEDKEARRYTVSDQSETWVERFHYDGSELPEDVATGFIVHGVSPIVDHTRHDEQHDVEFTLMGGKGLSDRKEAVLTFVSPDTGEESTVEVDLKLNKLFVPDSCRELFTETEFTENGYGPVTLDGLNGGDPDLSFQHPTQARRATKWVAELTRQSQQNRMIEHPVGMSLWELEHFRRLSPSLRDSVTFTRRMDEFLLRGDGKVGSDS